MHPSSSASKSHQRGMILSATRAQRKFKPDFMTSHNIYQQKLSQNNTAFTGQGSSLQKSTDLVRSSVKSDFYSLKYAVPPPRSRQPTDVSRYGQSRGHAGNEEILSSSTATNS